MEGTMSEIRLFAPDFAPKSWALCYGQTLAISTNQALFSLLGTTYGGNGIQTFMLPDFRGRAPMGTGPASGVTPYVLGQIQGTNSITATSLNLPSHNHIGTGSYSMSALSDGGDSALPTGNALASLAGLYSSKDSVTNLKSIQVPVTVNSAGNNLPIPVQQPYLGMNYIICLYGIFPSRN
jgi:microcystin-dependent protein